MPTTQITFRAPGAFLAAHFGHFNARADENLTDILHSAWARDGHQLIVLRSGILAIWVPPGRSAMASPVVQLDWRGWRTLAPDVHAWIEWNVATDARLRAEIYSYSRTRGLFAGLSLGGAVIANDRDANRAFERDSGPNAARLVEGLKARLTEAGGANRIRRPD